MMERLVGRDGLGRIQIHIHKVHVDFEILEEDPGEDVYKWWTCVSEAQESAANETDQGEAEKENDQLDLPIES